MTQRSPHPRSPLVPCAIAAPVLLAALLGCPPVARLEAQAAPVAKPSPNAAAPAPAPAAPGAAIATPPDSTPPLINGVEVSGVSSDVAIEHPVSGHLVSLNGRYKLRASMAIFEPGGYIGGHHHAGPGMRYVLAGDLAYTELGHSHVYHRGDWFYESGDTLHAVANHSAGRDTILSFEILPVDWYGPSTMPAPTPR